LTNDFIVHSNHSNHKTKLMLRINGRFTFRGCSSVLAPSIRFNHLRSCSLNLHDDGPPKARINADYIKNEVFALKKTRQTSLRKKDAAVSKLVKEVMDTKKLEHMSQQS
jgi:hypothetical protein